jgi:hypothetical protein
VVRRRDDDRVDVLVVHHTAKVLHEARLERGDVREPRVVDPFRRQVRVDVAERLDFDVLESGEAALQRVALSADADARGDDAIVRADDASPDKRRRLEARTKQIRARCDARRRRAHARGEFAPCDAIRVVSLVRHSSPRFHGKGYGNIAPLGVRFLRQGDWYDH